MQGLAAGYLIVPFSHYHSLFLYFTHNNIKREPKTNDAHIFSKKLFKSWLAVNVDTLFSSLQFHCLKQSKQPYAVIGMHMSNKDLHFLIHSEARFDKVALHSLAGIKE